MHAQDTLQSIDGDVEECNRVNRRKSLAVTETVCDYF